MRTPVDSENAHGLRRSSLTADIKREVRQRCGFGCVICGSAIIQYHHFDPPFADAKEHRAMGITLLCGGCHDKVTRGIWSDDRVRAANANPKAKQSGAHEFLDLSAPVTLIFGTMVFVGTGALITIGGECLLEVRFVPEGPSLSARFFDDKNRPTVIVIDNELQLCADAWDVEAVGRTLLVRRGPSDIVFKAQLHPPHGVYVRTFNVKMGGWRIATDSRGRIQVIHQSGRGLHFNGDAASIHGGPLDLGGDGKLEQRGGFGMIPYPASRFRKWASEGEIKRLLWELRYQPVLDVCALRDARKPPPPDAFEGRPIGNGQLRYPLYCEVCNEDRAGRRDLPEGKRPPERSGILCERCAARPPDAWGVVMGRGPEGHGPELARFADRSLAISDGHRRLKENPTWRLVIHGANGEAPTMFFGTARSVSITVDPLVPAPWEGCDGDIYIGRGDA